MEMDIYWVRADVVEKLKDSLPGITILEESMQNMIIKNK